MNKIIIITALLLSLAEMANAQMGMDSTSLVPFPMKPVSNINIITTTYISPPITNGRCGSDSGATVYVTPTALCTSGTASNPILSGLVYTWNCSGQYGGNNSSCTANQIQPAPPKPPTPPAGTFFCTQTDLSGVCMAWMQTTSWVCTISTMGPTYGQYSIHTASKWTIVPYDGNSWGSWSEPINTTSCAD